MGAPSEVYWAGTEGHYVPQTLCEGGFMTASQAQLLLWRRHWWLCNPDSFSSNGSFQKRRKGRGARPLPGALLPKGRTQASGQCIMSLGLPVFCLRQSAS